MGDVVVPPDWLDGHATLRTAAQLLMGRTVGVVVVQEPGSPPALLTSQDVLAALAAGADPDLVWAADVTATATLWLARDEPLDRAAEIMRDGRSPTPWSGIAPGSWVSAPWSTSWPVSSTPASTSRRAAGVRSRRWLELTSAQRLLVLAGGVLELVLTAVALTDLVRRPAAAVRGSEALWPALLFVQPVGYLLLGSDDAA